MILCKGFQLPFANQLPFHSKNAREIRLATTGMASASCSGGAFIDSSKLDLRRYARQPALAMALADYLLYVERNPRRVGDQRVKEPCIRLHSLRLPIKLK